MTPPPGPGDAPARRRERSNAFAVVAMVAVAVVLLGIVLVVEGVRPEASTWLIGAAIGLVVLAVLVLAGRRARARAGATAGSAPRRPFAPPPPTDPVLDLDLLDREVVDPLAPIPDDQEVLDADASDIDLTQGPTVRVVLHPGPVTRRRLAGRPDALVIVADAEALDVPGWIVEGRSRVIERTDRVRVPWAAIERFRVRADDAGPDVYDITARPDVPAPHRWRIRRDEIADEVALLDHVRRVGRITIELEDSIRS